MTMDGLLNNHFASLSVQDLGAAVFSFVRKLFGLLFCIM